MNGQFKIKNLTQKKYPYIFIGYLFNIWWCCN